MIFARKQIKWDCYKVQIKSGGADGVWLRNLLQRQLLSFSKSTFRIECDINRYCRRIHSKTIFYLFFINDILYIDPEEVRLSFSLILWSLPTCHATRMKRNIWTELVSICFLFWIELTQRRAATAAAAPHGDKYNKNGQQLMQCDRKGDCDENEADQPASLNLNQGDHQQQHVRSDFIQK